MLEPQHRQGGKSLKIVISSKPKKINRWGMDRAASQRVGARSPNRAGCYKVLVASKTLERLGRKDRAPQSSNPPAAGLVGTHCSLCLCIAVCCHTGLEGWTAAAPGTTDLPLHWADGEIITEWAGEEPVDFLAPGIVCDGSLGSCSAVGIATLMCEGLGSIPELSMFQ